MDIIVKTHEQLAAEVTAQKKELSAIKAHVESAVETPKSAPIAFDETELFALIARSPKKALDLFKEKATAPLRDANDLSFLLELDDVSNLRYGLLFILALSSLTVYSIVLAG